VALLNFTKDVMIMAYNPNKPANDGYLAEFPPEMREQLRAITNDQIVDAQKLAGLSPGNLSGNIPVSNGTLCNNLNADKLDGNEAAAFAAAEHVHPVATTSINGFMIHTDKAKLDSVATGAEVNQNAFSNVKVGSTTIQADSETDTLELVAGANIALTPDATNDRVTVAVTGTVPTATTATNATNHINASSGAHAASAISCTATGDVAATNVQAAITELASEKVPVSDVVTAAAANKILKLNSSGQLPAAITGNAATATKLATARTVALTGDVTGSGSFDGSANISIVTSGGVPTGAIFHFPATIPPSGYLELNGALVSRSTYAILWAYAQSSGNIAASDAGWQAGQFSPGNGSTTFRIPDLRGVFIRGYDHDRGLDTTSLVGDTTNGSAVITGLSSVTVLKVGMSVSGPGIPSGATIQAINSSIQITLSANATATATGVTLTFTGRIFGSLQTDQNQSHTHLIGKYGYRDPAGGFYWPGDATNNGNIYTGASGGTEARPKNVALLPCIKY
jgi:hypothetical protein